MAILAQRYRAPFLLSLVGHLLLVVNFTFAFMIYRPKAEDKPNIYVPAYVYQPSVVMPPPQHAAPQQHVAEKNNPTAKDGILKPATHAVQTNSQSSPNQFYQLKPLQYTPHSEPPDEKSDPKVNIPLLNLLHDAVAKHLVYPKAAVDFNESGTVKVGFLIYPNGEISQVTLLHSSGSDILDNAAIAAVNEMWPVPNVNKYIKKPEFVAGYIVFKIHSGGDGGSWSWES